MPYAVGTCRGCGSEPELGKTRCAACAKARRQADAVKRDERRAAGLCLTCAAPVARMKRANAGQKLVRKPARYCAEHLRYYAARAAAG